MMTFLVLMLLLAFSVGAWVYSPIFMIIWVIILSCICGAMLMSISKWAALMVVILYVGGMMVLFSYVMSLSYLKKTSVTSWNSGLFLTPVIFLGFISLSWSNSVSASSLIANFTNIQVLLLMTGYLLGSLLVVSFLVGELSGSLKSNFNDN